MNRAVVPPVAVLALAACAVLAGATPAAAHGGNIHFAITAHTDGRTQTTASYDDGDPVDEPVAATLSAISSDGRTVGPWPLLAVAGTEAAYTTRLALPPGSWKVSVDSAFPELGHGESDLAITAVPNTQPSPSPATIGPTAPSAAVPAPPHAAVARTTTQAAARPRPSGQLSLVLVTLAGALGVGAAAAAVIVRRR
ncbi:hypothetical protein [Kitasatospora sp. MAP5-34]|uniref:hypothetical protein n=1 Tax=Kitasatospora sp. MAP5-34 TaxID=3035102 RepID=UPI002475147A|nr:hypothetical protein [Kitasatospora sp. MAP5-34]MDH6580443.1 hypothetical protein [Kitasatospora sp. MAP5-34]